MARAYYSESIVEFLDQDSTYILGSLTKQHQFALEDLQRNAWIDQVDVLKANLVNYRHGHILLEFSIPRMGRRVDVVLLISGVVIILEFKVGDSQYSRGALDQVLDYALDLKNFHEQSHNRPIVPVVVATEATSVQDSLESYDDNVFAPLRANRDDLRQVIARIIHSISAPYLNAQAWQDSRYKPTPTIIEAAQALYRGHDVEDISRSDGGAINLSLTAQAITAIIDEARTTNQKSICFVTGVPGAGKTLAGLNIANERLKADENEHTVFLSGNGPLVMVLREALVRDAMNNRGSTGRRGLARRTELAKAQAFIQNIHHFRDDALDSSTPPLERVVVFDEAQRAWTLKQAASFMRRKRNFHNFSMSEPNFLISVMDRHPDWAVIVCLIGGGQEINTGEAGLLEWFEALRNDFPHWRIYHSPNLTDDEYTRGHDISEYFSPGQVKEDQRLHLAVSVRSFRAENMSALVKAILDNNLRHAQNLHRQIGAQYPIVITRDISRARAWLKSKARGTERCGLLASSGGIRLRPIGVNVRVPIDVVSWFLNGKDDVRSSYYLEDAATEFDVQGLELDWTCVVWDADLRHGRGGWDHKSFRGTAWQNISDDLRKRYLRNAYRVLLTRARQGMVIVVPHGSEDDYTRRPTFYDGTYSFLERIGFEVI